MLWDPNLVLTFLRVCHNCHSAIFVLFPNLQLFPETKNDGRVTEIKFLNLLPYTDFPFLLQGGAWVGGFLHSSPMSLRGHSTRKT